MPSNRLGSVAVIHTWPRPSRRAKRAARRLGSRWAATSSSSSEWRLAAALRDQLGMGHDEAEEQRLLLAGRGIGGGHGLGAMSHGEVLAVRAPVARPAARRGCGWPRARRRDRCPPSPRARSRRGGTRHPARCQALVERCHRMLPARRRSPRHARPSPVRATPATPGPGARRRGACCARASPHRSGSQWWAWPGSNASTSRSRSGGAHPRCR